MSLILNIDTALETASLCLTNNGETLGLAINDNQKDHAGWIHTAIKDILHTQGIDIQQLNAIAVTIGPGSYTGLRVGLSTAKGLCYSLNIPLITIGTLDVIASACMEEGIDLICPMIDARRMEVFAAVYDKHLRQIVAPYATIIDDNSFSPLLSSNKVLFCGNGSYKLQTILLNNNALFSKRLADASHLGILSHSRFSSNNFDDIIYTEPLYIKEFYSTSRKAF